MTKGPAKLIAPEIIQDERNDATPPKSKGERVFDRAVYGGLAGVVTFITTLVIADALKHGRWKNFYAGATRWTQGKLDRFLPASHNTHKIAEQAVMTTSLMMGGNAMLLPIGLAEHYKVPIVSGLNTALGDATPPEKIQQAPKQTWWSLIEGRAVAWGAVFSALTAASLAFKETFEVFPKEVGERFRQMTQWIKREPYVAGMTESRSYRYGKIAAFDAFATIAAASILYIGGHFFARKHEEKKASLPVGKQRASLSLDAEPSEPAVPEGEGKERPANAITRIRAHEGQLSAAPQQLTQGH